MPHPSITPGRPSNTLHFVVGEMSGKLDQIMATLLPQLTELDTRVKVVELKQALTAGGVGVIVFIITTWEVTRYVFKIG